MKSGKLAGMVTTFNGWTADAYFDYLQRQFNRAQLNLPTKITEADRCFAREHGHESQGHTSASGDEFGGLPAGFCIGKDVC